MARRAANGAWIRCSYAAAKSGMLRGRAVSMWLIAGDTEKADVGGIGAPEIEARYREYLAKTTATY